MNHQNYPTATYEDAARLLLVELRADIATRESKLARKLARKNCKKADPCAEPA